MTHREQAMSDVRTAGSMRVLARAAATTALLLGLAGCGGDATEPGDEVAAQNQNDENDPGDAQDDSAAEVEDTETTEDTEEAGGTPAGDGWDGDGPWFTIDDEAGTVTLAGGADPDRPETVTVPIIADVTWTIDGAAFEFAAFNVGVDQCPVPASGNPDDIVGFRGVGLDPSGAPMNLNANSAELAINTTYEPDWRATTTAHDWFGPDWTVTDREMTAATDAIAVVDSGERVTGDIVVTCR